MKKLLRSLLLAAVLCAALCMGALAADDPPAVDGIYGLSGTLKPMDVNANAVTGAAASIDGAAVADFYAGAVKLGVTVSGLEDGEQYTLLLVRDGENGALTAESIYYIDQTAASGGSVSFIAYPKALEKGTYTAYLTGGARKISDGSAVVGRFTSYQSYTLGDVTGDDKILVNDAQLILNYLVDKSQLTPTQLLAADVTHDGKILVNDAQLILNYLVDKATLTLNQPLPADAAQKILSYAVCGSGIFN